MKLTTVDVTFRLSIYTDNSDITALEVVKDLEYDFQSRTEGASVEEAKIIALDIDDEDV